MQLQVICENAKNVSFYARSLADIFKLPGRLYRVENEDDHTLIYPLYISPFFNNNVYSYEIFVDVYQYTYPSN